MEEVMLITMVIIAITSLLLNGAQWVERKYERKDTERIIREGAVLEEKLKELTATYDNEVNHRKWAIGRINDQQAVIDQLKGGKTYKPRKEGSHA